MGRIPIKVSGTDCPISSFIKTEYEHYIVEDKVDNIKIAIEIIDDKVPENSYVVRPPVSYDENGVYIFDSERSVVRIDFDNIGSDTYKITCDKDFNPQFFAIILEYLIYLEFLGQGSYFCHSCAFKYHDKVILCPAWRNVGKTNLLIAFSLLGDVHYIADDWSLINKDGKICTFPKRINLLYYNFLEHPELTLLVDSDFKLLVEFTNKAMNGKYNLSEELLVALKEKARIRLDSDKLFDSKIEKYSEKIDFIFVLTKTTNTPERGVNISPLEHEELFTIVQEIIQFEHRPFRLAYSIHKAQTGSQNAFMEKADDELKKLIKSSLGQVNNVYKVYVPDQKSTDLVKEKILDIIK